jgi:hypothetical protein
MCKTFDVSVITGLYSYAIAYYLYRRNFKYDRAVAIFLVTFSTIQWVEAFLWYDVSNPITNKIGTALIPIVLGLEFMSTYYAASMHFPMHNIETIIYVLSFIAFNVAWFNSTSGLTTVDPNTKSLLWGGIGINTVARFLFLGLLLWPLFRFVPSSTSIGLIILVTTVLFFYSFKFGDTFGSNWCWIANIVALLQLFAPIIG